MCVCVRADVFWLCVCVRVCVCVCVSTSKRAGEYLPFQATPRLDTGFILIARSLSLSLSLCVCVCVFLYVCLSCLCVGLFACVYVVCAIAASQVGVCPRAFLCVWA
jgi:hypothetical protein